MVRITSKLGLALGATIFAASAAAQVKIAMIEGLSGPFAAIGEAVAKGYDMELEAINARGGVLGGQKLELIRIDNKSSPQESLIALKSAIDQGIRYVAQGNSSAVAHALVEGIAKHNERNPDKTILFLNYSAVDPTLTNEKCNFWHFRFDANSDMKMEVITNYLANDKAIRSVFLIGQDYAHGHQVARAAKAMLARKRPDVKIVGEELHPIGRVKDFAPYVAKIKASGADTIITGNWGNDLALLIKAAKDAGLTARFFTYYAGATGTPAAIGEAGADRVAQLSEWHINLSPNKTEAFANDYKKRHNTDYILLRGKTMFTMFADAINKAKSAEPIKVAQALEDMRFASDTGEVWMRKSDHQLHQPLYLSIFSKVDGKAVKFDSEGTGYGWKTALAVTAKETELPTTCKMERP